MKITARVRRWTRRTRRRRAAEKDGAPLREFVYLDEISVYSLLASRLGPIATEFSDSETATLQADLASSMGTSIGLARADLGSRISSTQTSGSQVLRKSTVQTAFKDLYEFEQGKLVMRPALDPVREPKVGSWQDLRTMVDRIQNTGSIINPTTLKRGQLFEAEVELGAEAIFRVSAVAASLLDLVDGSPELFGRQGTEEILSAQAMSRILERLLADLVPIRGRSTEYVVAEVDGTECIVRRSIVEHLPLEPEIVLKDLYVVGVAEKGLFWRDIRRVLFSQAKFRVLCRLGEDGLRSSWTPVKLADVMAAIVPDFGQQLDLAGETALQLMQHPGPDSGREVDVGERARSALGLYMEALVAQHECLLSKERMEAIIRLYTDPVPDFSSVEARRELYRHVTDAVDSECGTHTDPVTAAQLRMASLLDVGIEFDGNLLASHDGDVVAVRNNSGERFLDSEFVAIYW